MSKKGHWVLSEGTSDRNELDNINAALAAFIFSHERLGSIDSPCHLMLCEAGSLARRNQELPELQVFFAVDRSAHVVPGRGNERGKLIPLLDYPK